MWLIHPRQAGWMSAGVAVFRRGAAVCGLPSQRDYTTIISRLLAQRRRRGLPTRRLAYGLWAECWELHAEHLDGAALRAGRLFGRRVPEVRWLARIALVGLVGRGARRSSLPAPNKVLRATKQAFFNELVL
jgi:hypothetical protein